jgi:hypothetical protein
MKPELKRPESAWSSLEIFHGAFGPIVAALIGGFSLIVVALVSFSAGQRADTSSPERTVASTKTVTVTATADSKESQSRGPEVPGPAPELKGDPRVGENLKLVKSGAYDLDSTESDWGQSFTGSKSLRLGSDIAYSGSWGGFHFPSRATKVSGDPDPVECVDPTNVSVGKFVTDNGERIGQSFCFLTGEGRTAWVTVVDDEPVAINVTVWPEPAGTSED